ncbi:ubiquinol-cytochrome C reductase [Podospora australis]|uniref:Complex III subunit 9 n=1 Tax=Podospora australis TaxID=1536484 RepID=A0AAN6X3S8_9PEZI|nr:ubiquinol-cytochrome C reductase [Podospora australis]
MEVQKLAIDTTLHHTSNSRNQAAGELRPISVLPDSSAAAWFPDRLHCTLFRRNYTMLGAVFAGAFAFEMGYDTLMNKVWDNNNKGRQWKDIRHKYITEDDE